MDLFYVVWCPQSEKPIRRKFASIREAAAVKDALLKDNPDRTFHVLVSVPEDIVSFCRHKKDDE